ncbi:MAG TPA: hypothetical protein VG206_14660 [Terriglobia bacterium]|nr:hypothetical protein [Terriglobia bacterium]
MGKPTDLVQGTLDLLILKTIALVLAIGAPAALAVSRLVATMLYGLKSTDPVTIATATAVLVTVNACGWVPSGASAI